MVEKSQEYLRLALAAAAILIGLSVAYHYVIYIPQKDRAREAEIQSRADREAQQLKEKQGADSKAALARRTNYRVCLSEAQADYHGRWTSTCKSRSDEAERDRADCIAKGFADSYCRSMYPPLPAAACSLPGSVSENYDAMLRDDKKRCLDEAKSDVAPPL